HTTIGKSPRSAGNFPRLQPKLRKINRLSRVLAMPPSASKDIRRVSTRTKGSNHMRTATKKQTSLIGAGLCLAFTMTAGLAHAELKVTGSGKDARMAPDQFPADQQERLKLFEAKCGKCHDLDRPITAIKTGKTPISGGPFDDDGVKAYVTKMM